MKIYLVRHGETDWNKLERWQGHTDVPLNETGIEQANGLAEIIGNHSNISMIYASPLIRAYRTAEILNQTLNVEIVVRDGLKEVSLGVWEGMNYAGVLEKYPNDYELWRTRSDGLDLHLEVETLSALQKRAFLELDELRKISVSDFMIVGHGAWIGNLLREFLHVGNEEFLKVENTKLIEMIYDETTGKYYVISDLQK